MKVSMNWLADFVSIDQSAPDIAERLTRQGLEVDALHQMGDVQGVVVGRILSCEPHPDADKLSICTVSTGADQQHQIVCGATNMQPGDLVPTALPGALLPGGFKIKRTKLRGQRSEGMLCSGAELGLEEQSEGLLILDPQTAELPLGQDIVQALQLRDTAIEIGLTPNRGDCLSHIGVAREIAAMSGAALRRPELGELSESDQASSDLIDVHIAEAQDCPRYMARVLRNVQVTASPQWLQNRLIAVGVRPINNIVDITNYVMFALGHPLHAFDLQRLGSNRILVRRAQPGEQIRTLDDQIRDLDPQDILITNGQIPIAIGGVMGGADSAIDEQTTDVLLEAASFDGSRIRRTAARLALHSESSHRFERGVDPNGCAEAIDYAALLIQQLADASPCAGAVDNYPAPPTAAQLELRLERLASILGIRLSTPQLTELFERLQMRILDANDQRLLVEVPTHATDILREIDLIEEVARLYGYDQIPSSLPPVLPRAPRRTRQQMLDQIREQLASQGYSEAINYSFASGEYLEQFLGSATRVRLLNPISEDLSTMRTSLIPSLAQNLRANQHLGLANTAFFEIAETPLENQDGTREIPARQLRLAMILQGQQQRSWHHPRPRQLDCFDLKGDLEMLADALGVALQIGERVQRDWLHPGIGASILLDGEPIGLLGELHPRLCGQLDLPEHCCVLEIDLPAILRASVERTAGFHPISRYPAVHRDLALACPAEASAAAIEQAIRDAGADYLESVRIFDRYEGLGDGRISLAFELQFRNPEHTLSDADVDPQIARILAHLEREQGARLR